jgi:hypothetical protein
MGRPRYRNIDEDMEPCYSQGLCTYHGRCSTSKVACYAFLAWTNNQDLPIEEPCEEVYRIMYPREFVCQLALFEEITNEL